MKRPSAHPGAYLAHRQFCGKVLWVTRRFHTWHIPPSQKRCLNEREIGKRLREDLGKYVYYIYRERDRAKAESGRER